jgi:hypothetical protein
MEGGVEKNWALHHARPNFESCYLAAFFFLPAERALVLRPVERLVAFFAVFFAFDFLATLRVLPLATLLVFLLAVPLAMIYFLSIVNNE